MSKYTTEVRFICETEAGYTQSKGFNEIDDILNESAPKIFNFDFPIFDENYRLVLEKQILRHYYTREICEETVGLWKLRLCDKLNLIMPKYNEIYKLKLKGINPFMDTDYQTTKETEGSGTKDTNKSIVSDYVDSETKQMDKRKDVSDDTGKIASTTDETDRTKSDTNSAQGSYTDSNTRWDLFSDTPQGGVNGIDGFSDNVENNGYLTNARKITDSGSGSNSSSSTGSTTESVDESISSHETIDRDIGETEHRDDTKTNRGNKNGTETGVQNITNTETYLQHVIGKKNDGISYMKILMEYHKMFLGIDQMIVNELADCFIQIW